MLAVPVSAKMSRIPVSGFDLCDASNAGRFSGNANGAAPGSRLAGQTIGSAPRAADSENVEASARIGRKKKCPRRGISCYWLSLTQM